MTDTFKKQKLPFTQIPNALITDPTISGKAKAVYCYLASRPDDWIFYTVEIQKNFKEGREAISNALNELIEHRWLLKKQIRDDQGKFSHNDYELFWKKSEIGLTESRLPESRKPVNGKPSTNNKDKTNTDITKKDKTKKLFSLDKELIKLSFDVMAIIDESELSESKKLNLKDWVEYKFERVHSRYDKSFYVQSSFKRLITTVSKMSDEEFSWKCAQAIESTWIGFTKPFVHEAWLERDMKKLNSKTIDPKKFGLGLEQKL